jgi:hypothetical protein
MVVMGASKVLNLFSLYLSLVFWVMGLFDLSITKMCFKFVNVAKVEVFKLGQSQD